MEHSDLKLFRSRIVSSNLDELDMILDAVLRRYAELISTAELVCLFLPRNNLEERKRILTQSVEFLLQYPDVDEK